MIYFVSKTNNRYDAPLDGINVFEVDVEDKKGQPPIATIKKILIGGLKNPNTEKIGTSWSNIFEKKEDVIKRLFKL